MACFRNIGTYLIVNVSDAKTILKNHSLFIRSVSACLVVIKEHSSIIS